MDADFLPAFTDAPDTALAVVNTGLSATVLDLTTKAIDERIGGLVVSVPVRMKAFAVSEQTLDAAYVLLKECRGYRKEWKAHMDPHIAGAQEAKRVAEANRKRLVEDFDLRDRPLEAAENELMGRIASVEDELARLKAEEHKRIQAAITKAAEDEALATAVTLIEEAKTAPPAEAAALVQAAEEIIDQPVFGPAIEQPSVRPASSKGVARPTVWSASVVDLDALLKGIVAKDKRFDATILAELRSRLLEAANPVFNKRSANQKAAMDYPGVRCTSNKTHSIR